MEPPFSHWKKSEIGERHNIGSSQGRPGLSVLLDICAEEPNSVQSSVIMERELLGLHFELDSTDKRRVGTLFDSAPIPPASHCGGLEEKEVARRDEEKQENGG